MKNNEYISIKEFAEKAKMSTQAVYKKLQPTCNQSLQPFLRVENGKKFIHIKALEMFVENKVATNLQPVAQPVARQNEQLYDILKQELEAKNKQIEKLQLELEKERQHSRLQGAELAKIADQSQQLQLAQLASTAPASETAEIKTGFFARFFKK